MRRGTYSFAGAIDRGIFISGALQFGGESRSGEHAPQRREPSGRAYQHAIRGLRKYHLAAGGDSQSVTHTLGDHHLTFGSHTVSHTNQYNPAEGANGHRSIVGTEPRRMGAACVTNGVATSTLPVPAC